ncbi:hypothetical protein EWM64_g5838 [Hericium alpestre]|uniref:Uncharacterized protein n=1 Tax=Hericium alpestre TaxID=135208 RepID=A0A4Y9ZXE4_9AGAM|nr:hypothetical protein EWM64_g5838 [Hericium alpestre]
MAHYKLLGYLSIVDAFWPGGVSPEVAQVIEAGRQIPVPAEVARVAYCVILHGIRGSSSLRLFAYEERADLSMQTGGHPPSVQQLVARPMSTAETREAWRALVEELQPLDPEHNMDCTSAGGVWAMSAALLSRRCAAQTWTVSTVYRLGDDARCVFGRVMISFARGLAFFIVHDVPRDLADLGSYPFSTAVQLHSPQFVTNQIWPAGNLAVSCRMIRSYRLQELARRVGASIPAAAQGARFSAASMEGVLRRYERAGAVVVVLTIAHMQRADRGNYRPAGDILPDMQYLHARQHGYVFPFLESGLRTQQAFLPSNDQRSLAFRIPEAGIAFQLFIKRPADVEYLGTYQRVPSLRVWPWHRSTKEEWELFSTVPVSRSSSSLSALPRRQSPVRTNSPSD